MKGGVVENARQWTATETKELIELQSLNGNSWATYAAHFNRTPSSVRNKYKRIVNKHGNNRCTVSGKLRRGHTCYKAIEKLCNDIGDYVNAADILPRADEEHDMCFDMDDITSLWKHEETSTKLLNVKLVLAGL